MAACVRHCSACGPEHCAQVSEVQAAARALGLQLVVLNARTATDIDTAFASVVRERVSALVVGAGGFFVSRRDQIIALAARHAIPAIYGFREYSLGLQQRADELIE